MNKEIKYLNKDFKNFISDLQTYAKTYFPNTVNDFNNPESPARLFMEMSAYVGDVLSFYLDNQILETFVNQAQDIENLFNIANVFGYKPKISSPATTTVQISQKIPAILSGSTYVPDYNYSLTIPQGTTLTSTQAGDIYFITEEDIDFAYNDPLNVTSVEIDTLDNLGNITYFKVSKNINCTSKILKTTTFTVGNLEEFPTFDLTDTNIIEIQEIRDSNNNLWYEVDSLGQDFVFEKQKNVPSNNPFYDSNNLIPNILKYKKVQRKFVTKFINNTTLQIQFGSGNEYSVDEEIVPNPTNVGLGIQNGLKKLTTAYSPTNFIFTNTYGIAPSNTILTVKYYTGNGIRSNIPVAFLNNISTSNVFFNKTNLVDSIANVVFNSLSCINITPGSGGGESDTIETLRQNIISNYNTQLRAVTVDDYLIRIMSMPSNFGNISKGYVTPSKIETSQNSSAPIDIYLLSYDLNKKLTPINDLLKTNITTYLQAYSLINDSINFKTPFIINIGIDFEIVTKPNYNNNLILTNCLLKLKEYFNIDNMQINQPIILRPLYSLLDNVEGVETVKNIKIYNKDTSDINYSSTRYEISSATKNNVIYPPRDISIFEVKYPDLDIIGRTVNY